MKANYGIFIAGIIIVLGGLFLFFVQGQDMPGQLPDLSMNQPSDNQSMETE